MWISHKLAMGLRIFEKDGAGFFCRLKAVRTEYIRE